MALAPGKANVHLGLGLGRPGPTWTSLGRPGAWDDLHCDLEGMAWDLGQPWANWGDPGRLDVQHDPCLAEMGLPGQPGTTWGPGAT